MSSASAVSWHTGHADEEDVTATYHDGIVTVSVGIKPEKKESVKKIEAVK